MKTIRGGLDGLMTGAASAVSNIAGEGAIQRKAMAQADKLLAVEAFFNHCVENADSGSPKDVRASIDAHIQGHDAETRALFVGKGFDFSDVLAHGLVVADENDNSDMSAFLGEGMDANRAMAKADTLLTIEALHDRAFINADTTSPEDVRKSIDAHLAHPNEETRSIIGNESIGVADVLAHNMILTQDERSVLEHKHLAELEADQRVFDDSCPC